MTRVGIIGGSGLYDLDGMTDEREEKLTTPFGDPSDSYFIGKLGDVECVFLSRHGRGHKYNPSEVNYRANIYGMKKLGVEWIIAITAVGSLQEEIVPGHVVIIDQFIDRTQHRQHTFFEKGIVAHVGFDKPMCSTLRGFLLEACKDVGATYHDGGCYVNMEGPAFSTIAEPNMHREFGAKVIGMTNMAEARLAREAEMSLATVAMATDYDCWRPGHGAVTAEMVVATAIKNVGMASKKILIAAIPKISAFNKPSPHANALKGAIMTAPNSIPPARAKELEVLVKKYVTIPSGPAPTSSSGSVEDEVKALKVHIYIIFIPKVHMRYIHYFYTRNCILFLYMETGYYYYTWCTLLDINMFFGAVSLACPPHTG
jgi:5'-methylthioadenosine phosphorylase